MRIEIGDMAPDFHVADSSGTVQSPAGDSSGSTLLCFFRYSGCPYCNLRVSQMIKAAPELERYNIRVVTVFQSSRQNILRDVGRQAPPFPIIPDPTGALYRRYGVTPSWAKALRAMILHPLRAPYAMFAKGFWPTLPDGDPHMVPADFLISPEGVVRLSYYGKDISDHVPLDLVYATTRD